MHDHHANEILIENTYSQIETIHLIVYSLNMSKNSP